MKLVKIIAMLYVTMNLSGCGIDIVTPFSPQYLETSFDKKFSKPSYIEAAEGMADNKKLEQDRKQYEFDKVQYRAEIEFLTIYSEQLNKRSHSDDTKP